MATWQGVGVMGLQVCREADGYQRHLVSPEAGLRRMIEESMMLIADPIITAVHRVHLLLGEAARCAAAPAQAARHLTGSVAAAQNPSPPRRRCLDRRCGTSPR